MSSWPSKCTAFPRVNLQDAKRNALATNYDIDRTRMLVLDQQTGSGKSGFRGNIGDYCRISP